MSDLPVVRQRRILEWLRESRSLEIEALAQRLGVSAMTIHRDLNHLMREHPVVKVRGGVVLMETNHDAPSCDLCAAAVSPRTAMIIHGTDEQILNACCPHCGLLLLEDISSPTLVLARDFLYGRMVNAQQASFVLASEVALCCAPSVLCFATFEDAARFQRGFGGEALDFSTVWAQIKDRHRSHYHLHP